MKTQLVATVAGGLVLFALQALTGALLGPLDIEMPPGMLPWTLLSNVLVAGVLVWFARRSAWSGWRAAAAIFAIAYGIGHLTALIEAYVFNLFPEPGVLPDLFLHSLLPALLFAPIVVWMSGRWRKGASPQAEAPRRSWAAWAGRFAACSAAYLLLYFAAGVIIFPYVQEFYEGNLPSLGTVVGLQLFVRGPMFAAIGLLLFRMVPAIRLEHAVMFGVAMSVIGGIAPLIIPNSFFPDAVRYVHLMEVVPSNFLFGFVTGWLLGGSRMPHGARMAAAA